MITLVIYGVIAIALAASAGYAFMSFSSSSRQLTQLQQNQVQMDTAAAALRASLLGLSNNGVAYAPVGYFVGGQAYMQLPQTLGVVGAAPWGQPYLYCPVSQATTNNTGQGLDTTDYTVQSPSGATYALSTLSNSLTQGNPYVIINATANAPPTAAGYVAFIVSTLGPGQTMPDCSAITVGATGPSVAGGSVRGVTAGFSFMQRVSASSDKMELYVGKAVTGDKSGRDTNNLTTMDNAMALWSALQPRLGMIYLENSPITTASNFNAQDVGTYDIRGQNASLMVETDPNNAATPVTLTLSTGLILPAATTFQNVNVTGPGAIYAYKPLTFRHVTFTGPAGYTALNVYGADLLINDSSLANVNLYAENSRVSFLNDTAAATGFTGLITASNSSITFAPFPTTITPFATPNATYTLTPPNANGVVLSAIASTVTIGAATGAKTTTVNSTGQFQMNGGNLAINSTGTLYAALANAAIQSTGTTFFINGALQANTGTSSAIRATASTITGGGSIKVYAVTNPCVEFSSTAGALVPIYTLSPTVGAYAGFANFANAQYGYPPLPSDSATLAYATDSSVASGLTATTTTGTDPYIPQGTDALGIVAPNYLDKTSFENGVRSIVNQEFRPGLNLYMTNALSGCAP